MNKISTTPIQSKTLMKLGIDVNTADMFWITGHLHTDGPMYQILRMREEVSEQKKYCPAWSLSALMALMPDNSKLCKSENGKYFCRGILFDNPLDAVFEEITHLLMDKKL